MNISGHALTVSIAICHDYIVSNELLRLALYSDMSVEKTIVRLARLASALAECSRGLAAECKVLDNDIGTTTNPTPFFPQPTSIPPPESEEGDQFPRLEYLGFFDVDDEFEEKFSDPTPLQTRSLFVANMNHEGKTVKVLVKFTRRYGEKGHRCLAQKGLAPELYHCIPVVGNVFMVVIELLKGNRLSTKADHSVSNSVFEDLKRVLVELGTANLVHGDLRADNIIIDESGTRAKVSDFDWVGQDSKARYPASINKTDLGDEWHKDVDVYAVMKKEHDGFAVFDILKPKYGKLDGEDEKRFY